MNKQTTRPTVSVRKDRGWIPQIVFCVLGFIAGVGIVFVVAIHSMWSGGEFREYPLSLYWMAGLFGTVMSVAFCNVLAWAFDIFEEEYLDGDEEEKR